MINLTDFSYLAKRFLNNEPNPAHKSNASHPKKIAKAKYITINLREPLNGKTNALSNVKKKKILLTFII